MRIPNKYLRNRAFHNKYWNRIRQQEHPYRTYCPRPEMNDIHSKWWWDTSAEAQIERNFEQISRRTRHMENGTHKKIHASSCFRRILNKEFKASERRALDKLRNGDFDVIFPQFKKTADWLYF